jgi:hypothetical protein
LGYRARLGQYIQKYARIPCQRAGTC